MIELIEIITAADAGALQAPDDVLRLPFDRRQKSRQRVRLDSGQEAGIFLAADASMREGDRLRTAKGWTVQVVAAPEELSTGRTADRLLFARACYHLGNRHVPLQIGQGWVRYQPDHVLDDMLRRLGLGVSTESAAFEPERGAYHSHAAGQGHVHGPGHAHAHDHDSDHGAASSGGPAVSE